MSDDYEKAAERAKPPAGKPQPSAIRNGAIVNYDHSPIFGTTRSYTTPRSQRGRTIRPKKGRGK